MLSVANLSRISNKQSDSVEARIASKLADGKFTDTGAKYSPEQARQDASNASLRMIATVDDNGKLTWRQS